MVYNTARYAKLPFRNATLHSHVGRVKIAGEGMGSVLLRTGGPGAGSSYSDMDDYIATTGLNPQAKVRKQQTSGMGLKSKLAEKLSKLSVEEPGRRRKNITMSM